MICVEFAEHSLVHMLLEQLHRNATHCEYVNTFLRHIIAQVTHFNIRAARRQEACLNSNPTSNSHIYLHPRWSYNDTRRVTNWGGDKSGRVVEALSPPFLAFLPQPLFRHEFDAATHETPAASHITLSHWSGSRGVTRRAGLEKQDGVRMESRTQEIPHFVTWGTYKFLHVEMV
jgi:hypothetical protein